MSARHAEIAIVRTGCANLASVGAALDRLGVEFAVTDDPDVVLDARAVVLPGVGAFGPAMERLRRRGLDGAICERVRRAEPLLAVCLGMQLLCRSSDESPGVAGLGVVPAHVERFVCGERTPQMGWNRIAPSRRAGGACRMLAFDWMYFAHSYRVGTIPEGWDGSITDYGGAFASALERGTLLACQFHPELSGAAGLSLIGRWLDLSRSGRNLPC